ncbi:hypothetical protein KIN20_007143 [Parelaphostrongylus tenuis]|uniref:Uncharacterized protein n=1 Tax=Parelaphostrongylus tenuis TaxID=148309 RepID=A0AAD5QHL1_PARTN|nr:hypothetical protein KIN20_007143 [Parelaphostrongylus tenuis]
MAKDSLARCKMQCVYVVVDQSLKLRIRIFLKAVSTNEAFANLIIQANTRATQGSEPNLSKMESEKNIQSIQMLNRRLTV